MDELSQIIASRVLEVRESKGWNQFALCLKSEIPQAHLSRIEKGKRLANPRTLIKLADALGVSVDYLLGRDET